jgi:hypothetical protein
MTLKIQKRNYKPIIVGDILYAKRFQKTPDGHYDEDHNWIIDHDKPKVWWLEEWDFVSEDRFKKYIGT